MPISTPSTALLSLCKAVMLLLVGGAGGVVLFAADFEQSIDIAPLLQKASTAGAVNVIATLKLPQPYVPEQQLLVPAAIERQRASIAQARNTLLASLRSVRADEYKRLFPLPQVALRVDAAALRVLGQSPQITAIQEDRQTSTLAPEYLPELARLTAKAEQTGTVNVIVGLKLPQPYVPESRSADRTTVERQRSAIAQARDALLASLRETGATEYAKWDPLPMVAIRVNAAALRLLAESSLITTIKEDGLSRPQ